METIQKTLITVSTKVNVTVDKVWTLWTDPKHIIHWSTGSPDWQTPRAENELRVGGKFLTRMEAKDGSAGFDFTGKYSKIELHKRIDYTIDDGRKVYTTFDSIGNGTKVTVSFEAEQVNSAEMQQAGWQTIMDNFKTYAEKSVKMEVLHFDITINASAAKVYKTTIGEKTYSEWTAEFNPTSHFDGSWEKGSKILFLGTDKDGSIGGMVSRIKENIPDKFVSIEHMGIVRDGQEVTNGAEVETWAGALENYTFTETDGKTLLSVDTDANDEFKSYFIEMWPKALKKLKSICER